MKGYLITKPQDANSDLTATKHSLYRLSKSVWIREAFKNYLADFSAMGVPPRGDFLRPGLFVTV